MAFCIQIHWTVMFLSNEWFSPADSYVLRWAHYSNSPANVWRLVSVKRVEEVGKCWICSQLLPLLSYGSWTFVKENPDRKKISLLNLFLILPIIFCFCLSILCTTVSFSSFFSTWRFLYMYDLLVTVNSQVGRELAGVLQVGFRCLVFRIDDIVSILYIINYICEHDLTLTL